MPTQFGAAGRSKPGSFLRTVKKSSETRPLLRAGSRRPFEMAPNRSTFRSWKQRLFMVAAAADRFWPVSDARGRRLNVGSARASGQTRRATRRFGARPAPLGAPRKNPQHPPRRNAGRRAPSGVAPLRTLRHLAGGGGERPAAAGARGAARRPEVETTSKEDGSDPDAEATVKRPPPHGPDAFRKRATASFTVSSVASEKWPAPATSRYVAFPTAADRRGPRPKTLSLSPLTREPESLSALLTAASGRTSTVRPSAMMEYAADARRPAANHRTNAGAL